MSKPIYCNLFDCVCTSCAQHEDGHMFCKLKLPEELCEYPLGCPNYRGPSLREEVPGNE